MGLQISRAISPRGLHCQGEPKVLLLPQCRKHVANVSDRTTPPGELRVGEPPPLRTRTARGGGRKGRVRARWSRGGERYDRPLSVVFEKVEAARSLA